MLFQCNSNFFQTKARQLTTEVYRTNPTELYYGSGLPCTEIDGEIWLAADICDQQHCCLYVTSGEVLPKN